MEVVPGDYFQCHEFGRTLGLLAHEKAWEGGYLQCEVMNRPWNISSEERLFLIPDKNENPERHTGAKKAVAFLACPLVTHRFVEAVGGRLQSTISDIGRKIASSIFGDAFDEKELRCMEVTCRSAFIQITGTPGREIGEFCTVSYNSMLQLRC